MPTVKKKGKAIGNSSDLLVHPKKKKKKNEVNDSVPESSEKKRKKLKVELDVAEASATKGQRKKLKEVKQEFPMRKLKAVICLPASAFNRKGNCTAESLKSPMHLKKPKVEIPESGPESSTEGRKVGAAELPLETAVKQEVIVYEVTSSAPGGGHNGFGKIQVPVKRPADSIPQRTDRYVVF